MKEKFSKVFDVSDSEEEELTARLKKMVNYGTSIKKLTSSESDMGSPEPKRYKVSDVHFFLIPEVATFDLNDASLRHLEDEC